MIDRVKIPDYTYKELNDLFGYDKAEEILNEKHYNFIAIQHKILSEKLKKKFGNRFRIFFWIVVLLIAMIYVILQAKMILLIKLLQ
jgi:hypothetical protein